MCKKYHLRRGFAAAHPILLTQLAESEQGLPLLPLLLLKPLLLLLTSQMATLGGPGRIRGSGPKMDFSKILQMEMWQGRNDPRTILDPSGPLPGSSRAPPGPPRAQKKSGILGPRGLGP